MVYSRRDLILKDIVELFIKTGEPVGSRTLMEEYSLPYSSATIRNEMMELENLGMIEKTHTSSGRVPSTNGYKYYVEHLRENDVDEDIKKQLALILDKKTKSIEDVIKESCEILAHMTNLASIVLGPSADEERLVSLQIIPLSENSMTAVFVTDKGYVENKTFVMDQNINLTEIQECVKMMNDRLKGTEISKLVPKMNAMRPIFQSYIKDHDAIYRAFVEALLKFTSERVSLFGKENLLDQPDFNSDISKLKKMVRLMEQPELLSEYVRSNKSHSQVLIGKNESGLGDEDIAVVTTKINVGDDDLGTIALVGPTRMDYDRVIGALNYVAEQLDKFFEERKEEKDGK